MSKVNGPKVAKGVDSGSAVSGDSGGSLALVVSEVGAIPADQLRSELEKVQKSLQSLIEIQANERVGFSVEIKKKQDEILRLRDENQETCNKVSELQACLDETRETLTQTSENHASEIENIDIDLGFVEEAMEKLDHRIRKNQAIQLISHHKASLNLVSMKEDQDDKIKEQAQTIKKQETQLNVYKKGTICGVFVCVVLVLFTSGFHSSCKSEKDKISLENSNLRSQLASFTDRHSEDMPWKEQYFALHNLNSAYERNITDLTIENSRLKNKTIVMGMEFSDLKAESQNLNNTMSQIRDDNIRITGERDRLQGNLDRLKGDMITVTQERKALHEENLRLNASVSELSKKNSEILGGNMLLCQAMDSVKKIRETSSGLKQGTEGEFTQKLTQNVLQISNQLLEIQAEMAKKHADGIAKDEEHSKALAACQSTIAAVEKRSSTLQIGIDVMKREKDQLQATIVAQESKALTLENAQCRNSQIQEDLSRLKSELVALFGQRDVKNTGPNDQETQLREIMFKIAALLDQRDASPAKTVEKEGGKDSLFPAWGWWSVIASLVLVFGALCLEHGRRCLSAGLGLIWNLGAKLWEWKFGIMAVASLAVSVAKIVQITRVSSRDSGSPSSATSVVAASAAEIETIPAAMPLLGPLLVSTRAPLSATPPASLGSASSVTKSKKDTLTFNPKKASIYARRYEVTDGFDY